jgi:hypothetical protein
VNFLPSNRSPKNSGKFQEIQRLTSKQLSGFLDAAFICNHQLLDGEYAVSRKDHNMRFHTMVPGETDFGLYFWKPGRGSFTIPDVFFSPHERTQLTMTRAEDEDVYSTSRSSFW